MKGTSDSNDTGRDVLEVRLPSRRKFISTAAVYALMASILRQTTVLGREASTSLSKSFDQTLWDGSIVPILTAEVNHRQFKDSTQRDRANVAVMLALSELNKYESYISAATSDADRTQRTKEAAGKLKSLICSMSQISPVAFQKICDEFERGETIFFRSFGDRTESASVRVARTTSIIGKGIATGGKAEPPAGTILALIGKSIKKGGALAAENIAREEELYGIRSAHERLLTVAASLARTQLLSGKPLFMPEVLSEAFAEADVQKIVGLRFDYTDAELREGVSPTTRAVIDASSKSSDNDFAEIVMNALSPAKIGELPVLNGAVENVREPDLAQPKENALPSRDEFYRRQQESSGALFIGVTILDRVFKKPEIAASVAVGGQAILDFRETTFLAASGEIGQYAATANYVGIALALMEQGGDAEAARFGAIMKGIQQIREDIAELRYTMETRFERIAAQNREILRAIDQLLAGVQEGKLATMEAISQLQALVRRTIRDNTETQREAKWSELRSERSRAQILLKERAGYGATFLQDHNDRAAAFEKFALEVAFSSHFCGKSQDAGAARKLVDEIESESNCRYLTAFFGDACNALRIPTKTKVPNPIAFYAGTLGLLELRTSAADMTSLYDEKIEAIRLVLEDVGKEINAGTSVSALMQGYDVFTQAFVALQVRIDDVVRRFQQRYWQADLLIGGHQGLVWEGRIRDYFIEYSKIPINVRPPLVFYPVRLQGRASWQKLGIAQSEVESIKDITVEEARASGKRGPILHKPIVTDPHFTVRLKRDPISYAVEIGLIKLHEFEIPMNPEHSAMRDNRKRSDLKGYVQSTTFYAVIEFVAGPWKGVRLGEQNQGGLKYRGSIYGGAIDQAGTKETWQPSSGFVQWQKVMSQEFLRSDAYKNWGEREFNHLDYTISGLLPGTEEKYAIADTVDLFTFINRGLNEYRMFLVKQLFLEEIPRSLRSTAEAAKFDTTGAAFGLLTAIGSARRLRETRECDVRLPSGNLVSLASELYEFVWMAEQKSIKKTQVIQEKLKVDIARFEPISFSDDSVIHNVEFGIPQDRVTNTPLPALLKNAYEATRANFEALAKVTNSVPLAQGLPELDLLRVQIRGYNAVKNGETL